jgi:heme-degrading monooxygenase HmoA
MFVRIVKMSFHEENIPAFLENFDSIKEKIRSTEGNRFLELYQDKNNPCIFFTYSYWETEEDLENYRRSALFDEVWTFTKKLFNEKPEAWSLDKVVSLQ